VDLLLAPCLHLRAEIGLNVKERTVQPPDIAVGGKWPDRGGLLYYFWASDGAARNAATSD